MVQGSSALTLDQKIIILSKTSNYYAKNGKGRDGLYMRNSKAIKLLPELTEEEANIIFHLSSVRTAILNVDNTDILRTIFKRVPAFFQEVMFNNEKIRAYLLTPRLALKKKDLILKYNTDLVIYDDNLKRLEAFLHTIKSSNIFDKLIKDDYFERIIMLCNEDQLTKFDFTNMDVKQLFNNIVNNPCIYTTRNSRKENLITAFNKISNHVLLSKDYADVIKIYYNNPIYLIKNKKNRFRDTMIMVDQETLKIMPVDMIRELLECENVDTNLIWAYLKNGIIESIRKYNYNYKIIFYHLTKKSNNFSNYDYLVFNNILDECQINEIVKKEFMDFIYDILIKNNDLTNEENLIIKEALYNKMQTRSMTKNDYYSLFHYPRIIKTLFYLKFSKIATNMNYIHDILPRQMMYLNVRHINQILKELDRKNDDELSNIYSIAIRLYFAFGLERSLKILKGDYGIVDKTFFDNVSRLDVSRVKLIEEGNKYLPQISQEFNNFMFANQKNNHFMELLANNDSLLANYWSELYNNFDDIKKRCHDVVSLKKVNIVLDQYSSHNFDDISPDNYKLKEDNIINEIRLGKKIRKSDEEVYASVLGVYRKMKKRKESSIPYVKGIASNGYTYEIMRFDDPIIFTLGYKTDCCFRTLDVAHKHLLHAALCRNGRILLIYDEMHNFAAFATLKRNGEVLIANSIECYHKETKEEIIAAFSEAILMIVKASKDNKLDNPSINFVGIGKEAYTRPDGPTFPEDIPVPTIYEKDDDVYKDTDCYHPKLIVLYRSKGLDYNNIQYGDPKASYQDPRLPVQSCDFTKASPSKVKMALTIINAIRYTNCDLDELVALKLYESIRGLLYCIYNEDWYVILTCNGNIESQCLDSDPRAIAEYNVALEELKKHCADLINNNQSLIKKPI